MSGLEYMLTDSQINRISNLSTILPSGESTTIEKRVQYELRRANLVDKNYKVKDIIKNAYRYYIEDKNVYMDYKRFSNRASIWIGEYIADLAFGITKLNQKNHR